MKQFTGMVQYTHRNGHGWKENICGMFTYDMEADEYRVRGRRLKGRCVRILRVTDDPDGILS